MDTKEVWRAVLGELEVVLSKANFTTWFKNTSLLYAKDGVFIISTPNAFTKEWLSQRYHRQIIEALGNVCSEVKEIKYQVGQIALKKEEVVLVPRKEEPRRDKNGELNPKYTFETFIVGNSNKLAAAACQAVTKNLGKVYNPLFIYGGAGLGKTHLLQAIGNEILKNYPKKKVTYVACESFTNDFIQAISTGRTNKFKETYRTVDLLLIDDIQFLAGKEGTQEEFFHTFNALHQKDKQIVISSDRPPKAIPTLEERLRSRFEWGMTADIQPPDLETRLAILQSKCQEKGFKIDLNILEQIAKNIQYNIRELEGALNRLMIYSQLNNINLTLETSLEILKDIISPPKKQTIGSEKILQTVASFYELKVEDLLGKKRNKELVYPRQISMYLLREEISQSYPKIGEILGGKDHTTIIYGVSKIKKRVSEDEVTRHEVSLIRERLYQ